MVFEKVVKILCDEFELDGEEITADTVLGEDLEIDSMDLVDLVMSIEDEFGMELPDEALEVIVTVGDLVNYIEEH